MILEEIEFYMEKKNRNFGIFFSIIILLVYFYLLFVEEKNNFFLIAISVFLIILSFSFPKIFKYPNKIWIKLGYILGKFISPIIMLIIYFTVIFLTFLYAKISKKDILKAKFNKNLNTYWEKHENYKNFFKQY